MSEFKRTKGNWKVGPNPMFVVSDTTDKEGFQENTGHTDSDYYGGLLICESVWKPSDAQLISAAPDLLEALQEMVRMYETIWPAGGWQGVHEMSKYAIQKALGNDNP